MKIDLGTVETRYGEALEAWIEPLRAEKASEGMIFGAHQLCVSGIRAGHDLLGNPTREQVEWKFSADTPGYERRIAEGFGYEAARTLMAEAKEYADRPFFAVYDHAKFGRLYASTQPGEKGFFLETRPEQTSLAQSIRIESPVELQALLTSAHLEASPAWMPTREMLAAAMERGQNDSERLFAARAEYEPVRAAFEAHIDRLSDYESLNMLAVRPAKASFETDSPEFYRWYTYGGEARPEPLTHEQLEAVYAEQHGGGPRFDNPAPSAANWEWLKNEKLGPLRAPIEILQGIVAEHTPAHDHPWIADAARQADWVRTSSKPSAYDLYSAIDGLVFRGETQVQLGGELPTWHSLAVEAREMVLKAAPDAMHRSDSRLLPEKLFNLQFNAGEFEAHVSSGDVEELNFYQHQVNSILRDEPVLGGLITLSPFTPDKLIEEQPSSLEQ